MATTNTAPGYVPIDSPLYTTPIQVTGHDVQNLTIARSPNGQAIFGWTNGNDAIYYCYVDPDFASVYQNDVCADGAERVVFDPTGYGGIVRLGSLWVDRGELFCAIEWKLSAGGTDVGYSKCYIADNVENPAAWTERGIISTYAGNASLADCRSCGPVTVLESGRWILPFPQWGPYAGGAICDTSGLAYSDDRGIDWTSIVSHRGSPGSGGTTGPIANTVGQDPTTGYLYWSFYPAALGGAGLIYESQDDGTSWAIVYSSAAQAWNFNIDDGISALYGASQSVMGEWEIWETTPDPTDESTFTDLNLTYIPSRQSSQFQAIVFLEDSSIAFIDTNRVAGQPIPLVDCPTPDPLHIPYKDRLLKLTVDSDGHPDPTSYDLMSDHDFDNLKEIERWAHNWMVDEASPDSCELFIPYKDHLRLAGPGAARLSPATQRAISSMSFDNYKVIERWARRLTNGECACAGPARCLLHIPFKDAALGIEVTDG